MKKWQSDIIVNKNIEDVWAFLDGNEENLKIMDSNIVSNKVIEETEERIGSRYLQVYREGKREEEYEVICKDYLDTENKKVLHIGFELAGMFDLNAIYTLEKIDENTTKVIYETTNQPLKFFAKVMMILPGTGSSKLLEKHLNHIKDVVENDKYVK